MVRLLMAAFVVALSLVLVSEGTAGKKKAMKITGAVVSVDPAKGSKDTGTLTIKTAQKKKKDGGVVEGKEVKVDVTKETKIEKAGKKKEPPTPATFADLQVGQNVTVTLNEGKAEVVLILGKKK